MVGLHLTVGLPHHQHLPEVSACAWLTVVGTTKKDATRSLNNF